MKSRELVKESNLLCSKLSDENKRFYEDLVASVHLKSGFQKDENVSEETLLVILQDLLQAQSAGLTAQEYLGKDTDRLAQEIVDETPRLSRQKIIKYALLFDLGFVLFFLVSGVGTDLFTKIFVPAHLVKISIANLLLDTVYVTVVIYLGMNSRYFINAIQEKYWKSYKMLVIPITLFIIGLMVIAYLTQNIWLITF